MHFTWQTQEAELDEADECMGHLAGQVHVNIYVYTNDVPVQSVYWPWQIVDIIIGASLSKAHMH